MAELTPSTIKETDERLIACASPRINRNAKIRLKRRAAQDKRNAKKVADKAADILQYEDKVATQAAQNAQTYHERRALKPKGNYGTGANAIRPNPRSRWVRAYQRKEERAFHAKVRASNKALRE